MNLKNFPKKLDSKTSSLRIRVPENLDLALEGLIRKVLREQPKTDDVYSFAAEYFETLVKIRDRAGLKIVESQICPFHNDEDAHEMIKLANAFPKPPPTEINSSLNEKNESSLKRTQMPDSKEEVLREEITGKQMDSSEKENGKIIKAGDSAKESLLEGVVETSKADEKIHQEREEVKIEDDEKFLSPDPIKELVEKEMKEEKVRATAAENEEVEKPGGQNRKKELKDYFEGEAVLEAEESCVLTGNPNAEPEINDEKRKEAREKLENLGQINDVETNEKTKVSSAELVKEANTREEEVAEGHFGKIREEYEEKTEEEKQEEEEEKEQVKDKGEEKESTQGTEKEKAGLGKATIKYDEGVKDSEQKEENTEKTGDGDKILGNQVQEAEGNVEATREIEERKTEAQEVTEEVKKREVEEKADERTQEIAKDVPIISKRIKGSSEGSQSDMNEPNEKMASGEKGKTFSEESLREKSKILSVDENETKIEQESGKEVGGTERTEEAIRGSYNDEGIEKENRNRSGAGTEAREQMPEGESAADEATKSASDEGNAEIETPEAGAEEAGNKGTINREEEQRVRGENNQELTENKESVGSEEQEMKKHKDEQVSPDQKSPRAKIHDSEEKKAEEELNDSKGEAAGETEKPNIPEERLEKLVRSLAVGQDEVKSVANEDIKEEDPACERRGDPEPNPESEHGEVKNKVEESQEFGAVRKEDVAMEARLIKSENDDALPSTIGSKENLNCEEAKKAQVEAETEDVERSQTGTILRGLPANKDPNSATKDETEVERKSQVLDFQEKETVVGIVETQTQEENAVQTKATAEEVEKSGADDEIRKNEQNQRPTAVLFDGRKKPGPENENNSTEKEESNEVEVEAETGEKIERATEAERGRKEEGEGEAGEETCGVVDKIHIIRIENAEKTEEEPQHERQIKTIATHYYDSLQIPLTEISQYRMGSAKEGGFLGEGKPDALAVPANANFPATSTSGIFADVPQMNSASATAIFLHSERQYNSRDKEEIADAVFDTEEGGSRNGEKSESRKEVEESMRKAEASVQVGAVASEPGEPGQIDGDSAAAEQKTKDKAEEEKEKSWSHEDGWKEGARSSAERRVSEVEEKEGERGERGERGPEPEVPVAGTADAEGDVEEESSDKEASPERAERAEDEDGRRDSPSVLEMEAAERGGGRSGGSDPTLSSAGTEIKRSDSGKRNFTRSSTRSLLATRSPDSGRRNSLARTRSLSSFRVEATDVEVWTAIEKELEEAATKIQSKFRGYKARKKLHRENAVESSSSSPAEQERQQGTGEFHDTIVLSDPPR